MNKMLRIFEKQENVLIFATPKVMEK